MASRFAHDTYFRAEQIPWPLIIGPPPECRPTAGCAKPLVYTLPGTRPIHLLDRPLPAQHAHLPVLLRFLFVPGLSYHLATTTKPECKDVLKRRADAIIATDASEPSVVGNSDSENSDDEMEADSVDIGDTSDEEVPGGPGPPAQRISMMEWITEGGVAGEGGIADGDEILSGSEDDEGGVVWGDDHDTLDLDRDEVLELPPELDQPPPARQPSEPPAGRDADTAGDVYLDEPFVETLASRAGEPLGRRTKGSGYEGYREALAEDANLWAPFTSKLDWELARWAKLRGPGSTAVSDLLGIEGLQDALGLSYKNSRELNKIIDTELPVKIVGDVFDVYYRNPLECVRALFGDPEFAGDLLFKPERHYTSSDKADQLYHEMNTGKWWWDTQKQLDTKKPGGTIVPVIISSDKTQVTLFGSKQAYPVYLTIGNIPKNIRRKPSRRAHILLAYLPTTNLKQIPSEAARRRAVANLFQLCKTTKKDLGNPNAPIEYRDLSKILDALGLVDGNHRDFTRECKQNDIKPIVHPFWENLPYVNIYRSITSDVLHQLYQGMIKHVISWIEQLYNQDEIDARCQRLPPNHHIRLFMNGISSLTRVTGKEHSQISSFLLGLIAESPPRSRPISALNQKRIVRAVRALLDFAFLAQYPLHSTTTLKRLITHSIVSTRT
ncbi:hypothetical protein BD779DRAFT_1675255 [Infundibulicybe gibba]|nr:hypothetical protein BD779DRAFT_1675255 [Infundibulicybe gibba]